MTSSHEARGLESFSPKKLKLKHQMLSIQNTLAWDPYNDDRNISSLGLGTLPCSSYNKGRTAGGSI